MTYPGQVKVTVIRETRAVNIANKQIVLLRDNLKRGCTSTSFIWSLGEIY
jgi:hypothetical protein